MKPRYSILYFKEDLARQHNKIREYLADGIKVFWFGKAEECEVLRRVSGLCKGIFSANI